MLEAMETSCFSRPLALTRSIPAAACTDVNAQLVSVRAAAVDGLALMMAELDYELVTVTCWMVMESVALTLSMAVAELLSTVEVLAKFVEEIVTSLNRRDELVIEKRPLALLSIFDTVMASIAKGFAGATSTAVCVHVVSEEGSVDATVSTNVYVLEHVVLFSYKFRCGN